MLTRDQDDPCAPPRTGRVTRVFRSVAPAILWLSFASGEVVGTTLEHEVWTDQAGWTSAGKLAVGDTFVDQDGDAAIVAGMRLDPTPTVVYNLEVEGAHTFFVDGLWVHNNSCRKVLYGAFDLFNVRRLPDSAFARRPKARGNAPIGRDDKSVIIHHVDQNPGGPFQEILASDHLKIRNKRPGLTKEERDLFNAARERYWEMQWDLGRFNHLPE